MEELNRIEDTMLIQFKDPLTFLNGANNIEKKKKTIRLMVMV